jgi:hypothetical protein
MEEGRRQGGPTRTGDREAHIWCPVPEIAYILPGGQLAVFQGANEVPISDLIRVE